VRRKKLRVYTQDQIVLSIPGKLTDRRRLRPIQRTGLEVPGREHSILEPYGAGEKAQNSGTLELYYYLNEGKLKIKNRTTAKRDAERFMP